MALRSYSCKVRVHCGVSLAEIGIAAEVGRLMAYNLKRMLQIFGVQNLIKAMAG